MVQPRLTRALHLRRHVRLAPLCTKISWLIVTSSCIASTIASCRWLVASRFSCHARDDLLHANMFCDCGHRELHRLPISPPRWWLRPQISDTAVHGVDERTETLSPFSAAGRPTNTTCPDTWPREQKTCCLCTAPLETGLLLQSSTTLRSRTNERRAERALHGQRIALPQTIGLRNTARSSQIRGNQKEKYKAMTRRCRNQHAKTMHGQVFLYLNDHTASMQRTPVIPQGRAD